MRNNFIKLTKLLICLFTFCFPSCAGSMTPENIKVTDISFSLSKTSIVEDETCSIVNVSVLPTNATNKTITYYCEDASVASVSNLVVTALHKGKTKVFGKTIDGSNIKFSVDLEVTSKAILVSEIQFSVPKTKYILDDKFTPTVTLLPDNADNKDFEIIASNNNVSINESTNEITCIKVGKTTLYAKSKDDGKVESSKVTITIDAPPTTGISLSADKTIIEKNQTSQINIEFTPSKSTDKAVHYGTKSGNNNVIKVSNTGLVTGVGVGTDVVEVYLISNPNVKDEISFTVTDIQPTSVTINLQTTVYKGDVYHATATVLPLDAFQTTPCFSISSGNASITEDGVLVPLGAGKIIVHVYLKEKTNITSDLEITSLDESDPVDPHGDDDF